MKKIVYLLICAFILVGCNFLDVVPDDTATLEDAFRNEIAAERFLFGTYSFMQDPRNFRNRGGRMTTNEMAGAARWGAQWFPHMAYIQNMIGAGSTMGDGFHQWHDVWAMNYRAIRQVYIFLERIGDVTPSVMPPADFERERQRWIGEAYFLLAYFHHDLFINYGPIVLVEGTAITMKPRSHVNDVVDRIVEWYDRAIELLPTTVDAADMGRATSMIAKTMRARLLLFAASPLFNGDPQGIWADADPEFRALVNTTRDNARWQRALTAIDEAITYAHANGARLWEWVGPDPATGLPVATPERQAYLNVRTKAITHQRNPEWIWGHGGGTRWDANQWERHTLPRGLGTRPNQGDQPFGAMGPTLTAAKIFYSANGLPIESDPNRGFPWTETGRMSVPSGAHTANLFLNREPRFHAAIGYHGGVFEYNNWTEHRLDMFMRVGLSGTVGSGLRVQSMDRTHIETAIQQNDRLETGFALKKMISPAGTATAALFSATPMFFPKARLAELYLAYAEAHAELHGNLNARARGFIQAIHNRAGLTNTFFFSNFTGDELIEAIRRERMIELIFESHWHFDLRRWQIAYQWHNHGMWATAGMGDRDGMWGLNILGTDNASFFREVNNTGGIDGFAELRGPILFDNRMHLQPIRTGHLNINHMLVQNPGY